MCSKIIDGSLFTFPQYTYIISEASFIVTVNTSIYHFAVQLNKPIVAISCNEHHTLQRYKDNQQLVFNNKLQSAYNNHTLSTYTTDYSVTLVDIDIESILKAIDNVQSHWKQKDRILRLPKRICHTMDCVVAHLPPFICRSILSRTLVLCYFRIFL